MIKLIPACTDIVLLDKVIILDKIIIIDIFYISIVKIYLDTVDKDSFRDVLNLTKDNN
jgi:hypothetical protein